MDGPQSFQFGALPHIPPPVWRWLDLMPAACSQPARKESLEEHHTAMGTHHYLNIISFRMSSAAQNFYRAHLFLIFSPLPSNNFLYFFIQTFFFRLLPTTTTAAGLLWSPSMSLTMFYRTCSVLGVWGSVDVSFPIIYCDCKINNKTLFIRLQTQRAIKRFYSYLIPTRGCRQRYPNFHGIPKWGHQDIRYSEIPCQRYSVQNTWKSL